MWVNGQQSLPSFKKGPWNSWWHFCFYIAFGWHSIWRSQVTISNQLVAILVTFQKLATSNSSRILVPLEWTKEYSKKPPPSPPLLVDDDHFTRKRSSALSRRNDAIYWQLRLFIMAQDREWWSKQLHISRDGSKRSQKELQLWTMDRRTDGQQ